ncbi:MAG: hypothetical protein M3Y25_04045 [Thermoproteota archaeon]|nr:hypothetical protein [Thermoproteota archaeon]
MYKNHQLSNLNTARHLNNICCIVVVNNDSAKTWVLDYGVDDCILKLASLGVFTNSIVTQLSRKQTAVI